MSGPSLPPGPRVSVSLTHHHETNEGLFRLDESTLASRAAYRGDHLSELRRAARSANSVVRTHYAEFIREVGRNVYPLIVFTDYEVDGPSGVGSTLTLYGSDGSVRRVSPAMNSNYELYKVCGHLLMGLAVEVGPYLLNSTLLTGDLVGDDAEMSSKACDAARGADAPWGRGLAEYLDAVRAYREALIRATRAEAMEAGVDEISLDDANGRDSPSRALPLKEMREAMLAIFNSVICFCESCLLRGIIDVRGWRDLNDENFPRIKLCMGAAAKAQANACVRQLIEWKEMLGPEEWRDMHVVIPTVWAVDGENPRKAMFRQLLDADRVDSHIICTEWPRDQSEARTLLGRVVGDRYIGRFVFGDETRERRIKTMGLSSEVDVVQDDALPAIWDALRDNGCPVRKNRSSVAWSASASHPP